MGYEVGRRREVHVGGNGGADDEIYAQGIGIGLLEEIFDRFRRHDRGSFAFAFENMTCLDADTGHYPLVGGVYHTAKFIVVENVVGQVTTHTGNSCSYIFH